MVYNTFENYDLGQSRARLATQEYSVNHIRYRYYKVKSQPREENGVNFIEKVSAMVDYNRRIIC
jgi:hypothetical protein